MKTTRKTHSAHDTIMFHCYMKHDFELFLKEKTSGCNWLYGRPKNKFNCLPWILSRSNCTAGIYIVSHCFINLVNHNNVACFVWRQFQIRDPDSGFQNRHFTDWLQAFDFDQKSTAFIFLWTHFPLKSF